VCSNKHDLMFLQIPLALKLMKVEGNYDHFFSPINRPFLMSWLDCYLVQDSLARQSPRRSWFETVRDMERGNVGTSDLKQILGTVHICTLH